jgi:hypothetical protein
MESSINFYSNILRQHGRDVLTAFRRVENRNVKIAQSVNNRIFLIRCARTNIVPKGIRLTSAVRGTRAARILSSAERKLVDTCIRQADYKIKKHKSEKDRERATLDSVINDAINNQNNGTVYTDVQANEIRESITTQLDNNYDKAFDRTKAKQLDKFG